jgi:ParB/RepB/Spo0J family partition protein
VKPKATEQDIISSVDELDLDLGEVEEEESSELDELESPTSKDIPEDDPTVPGHVTSKLPEDVSLGDDDLSLDDETPTTAPVDPIVEDTKPKPDKDVELSTEMPKDDAEIEIDLDIDEQVKTATATTPGPKKSKKKPAELLILDPEFSIDKIEADEKYQVRIAKLSNVEELAEILKLQGQIEPIRVVQEGEKFYLMAGFRRLAAMKMLGKKTIKAIIHQSMEQEEIMKISSGSNLGRENLSDSDKIFSIIRFQEQNKTKAPREIGKVFGVSESTAYRYLNIGTFLAKHDILTAEFKDKGYPYNVFNSVYMALKDDMDIPEEKICNFLSTKYELGTLGKKDFEADFSCFVSGIRVAAKIKSEEEELAATLDGTEESPKDIAKYATEILKKKGKIAKDEDDTAIATRKSIVDLQDSMLQCFALMEDYVATIQKIDDHKKYVDTKRMTKLQGSIAKFNTSIGKLI